MIFNPFLSLIILFGLLACLATAAPQHDCQCSQHKGSNGGRGLNARSQILPSPWPPTKPKAQKYRQDDTLLFWDGESRKFKCLVTSYFVNRSKSPLRPFMRNKIVDAVNDTKLKAWKCPKGGPVKKFPKGKQVEKIIKLDERNHEKPKEPEKPQNEIS
ncbi:hypothetical protein FOYG_14270 [Fusarium oxysporum NRRL 32931]|uniref:Uncharacterized protein n=1 Tax=Fusarium oxysporum NRRL 32931 TaxID=660029 RepID=W9HMN0_FUSOX|nr:hypothetical protein FOYG_14270 [Fusarium oxysporum NRRL 32931]